MNYYYEGLSAYYVDNYSDVMGIPSPMNGTPIICVNLDQGILWSKKLINGQAYIQSYSITPIANQTPIEEKPKDDISELKSMIASLQAQINSLGGDKNEPK